MAAYKIIIWIMAVFAIFGGIDRILENRFGLGKPFEEGILAMGSLALAMVGIVSLARRSQTGNCSGIFLFRGRPSHVCRHDPGL